MPAFGKDGIVNVNQPSSTDSWKVIKNGEVVKICNSELEANQYKSNLITSGIDKSLVQVIKFTSRCI